MSNTSSVKYITILGSTGSIGTQTLDIVRACKDQFKIVGLSTQSRIEDLKSQIKEFKPEVVTVSTPEQAKDCDAFCKQLQHPCTVLVGEEGLIAMAAHAKNNLLVVAIVGTAALKPTYEAIKKGITIGLACKEVLVAAGQPIMALAREKKVPILPIDSEHAAIKQCLAGIHEDPTQISRLILTASGGPFWRRETLDGITKEQALNHPNWVMGHKITIDSATLMNKGLEVIEAHHFFNVDFKHIEVVIHPTSIIHSLVEFCDGNILAHMGLPDMRFPIQYVLTYPHKQPNPWPKTDLTALAPLEFHKPDMTKFPLLRLAFECGEKGGSWPVILNAANESAVQLFLDEKIGFTDIFKIVESELQAFQHVASPDINAIIDIDKMMKEKVLHDHG